MIIERFPGLVQLPDEEKMTLLAELWKNVLGDAHEDNPALAELLAQRWLEYKQYPECIALGCGEATHRRIPH